MSHNHYAHLEENVKELYEDYAEFKKATSFTSNNR